jgi:hypothetical protein
VFTQQFITKAIFGLLIKLLKYSLLYMYSTGRKCTLAQAPVMVM